MRCVLFWDITQRRMVVPYRCFGTTFPSHLQGSSSPRRVLRCSETSVWKYQSTQRIMVVPYRRFGTFPSHLQGSNSPRRVLRCPETSVWKCQSTQRRVVVPYRRYLSVPSSRVKQSKKSVTLSRNVGMEIQVYAVYNPKTARISFCQIVYSDLQFAIVSAICTAHRRMSCSNTTTRRTSHYGKWVYRKSVYHIPLYINVYASSQKAINSKQKSKTRCLHYGRFYLPSWNET